MAYREAERFLYLETPLGANALLLHGFDGQEGLSQMFDFHLEILAPNPVSVDFDKLIGQKVSFGILGGDSRLDPRHLHGIVVELSQGERGSEFTEYRMRIAPEIWKLTRNFQSRIFQHVNVPDILKKALAGYDVSYEIQGTFEPREYCTQYQESDFDFISRLMEEEGIFYFFKFTHGSHKLVLANLPASHPDIGGNSKLIYEATAGGGRDEERISLWKKEQFWGSGKYTLWDHQFELAHRKLDASETVVDSVQAGKATHKLKLAGNDKLEIYEFPGRYAQRFDGIDKSGGEKAADLQKISQDNKRTAGIRMQQTEAPMLSIHGMSNCRQLAAGHKFTLQRHFNGDGQYVLTRVWHSAAEGDFRSGVKVGKDHYENQFASIPYALPFRPARSTRRPLIAGPQTAVVVGPPGEEIFTDKYGRVKVQFHWDREGKNDADSSCWLRVATPWAGKQWGSIFIPRIGHEVVVAFLEGDPDRPIVAGSVYNSGMMPPYDLPANKTQSGVKSRSSKGGGSDNYNEIMFEDLAGSELIRIHAEKDEVLEVENDRTVKIGHDEAITVGHDRTENVQHDETVTIQGLRKHYVVGEEQLQADGDLHLTASKNQNEKVGMNYSRSVGMNINDKAGVNYAMDAGTMIHLKAGSAAVIEAGQGLTIKAGGGSIDINPAGVFIKGTMVFINSGAANLPGCGSNPTAPTSPGQKTLQGIQAGAAASGAAKSAASAAMAQQLEQQVNASTAMASNLVQTVTTQAFAAVTQTAAQALAAEEASGQMAPGAGAQVLSQIQGAVQESQANMAAAANQAQQMLNTGTNAVRTGVQQSVQQTSAQVAQSENQASQSAAQTQQQLNQAGDQTQAASEQAAKAGQPDLGEDLKQAGQMLQEAQATEQQAQEELKQAANQAQQTSNQATQAGQQSLNHSTQQLNQAAQQAQQTAESAAQQAQAAAQKLQQTANQAAAQGQDNIAQQAAQAQQAAEQAAQQARQTADEAKQGADQASTQAQQMSQQTQQQIQRGTEAAGKQVTQAANQNQQQIQQATNQATQAAVQNGQMTPEAANRVQQQVNKSAQQAAQTAGTTAQSAYGQAGNTANQVAQTFAAGPKGIA